MPVQLGQVAREEPELVVVEGPGGQRQRADLLAGPLDQPRVRVPEVEGRVAGQAVEVATSFDVGHPGALAGRQHHAQRVVVVRGVRLGQLDVGLGVAVRERPRESAVLVMAASSHQHPPELQFCPTICAGASAASVRAMTDDLRARVSDVLPGLRRDLEDLVRIESVSADPARAGEVRRSAEAVRDLFAAEGFDAEILSEAGGAPAVVAHKRSADPGRADGAPLRPPRRPARERPRRLGLGAVRAHRARRPPLRPRGRRRQGRHRGAPRRRADLRRRPAGPPHRLRRGRGGGRLRVARAVPGRPPRRGSPPTSSSSPTPATGTSASRPSPPRCAAWSGPPSRSAPSRTPCTRACGAGWCPTP